MPADKQRHVQEIWLRKIRTCGVYLPLLLAVLVMLPRLFSPQFGLFDDGNSLSTSQFLLRGGRSFPVDIDDSRFRPVYWLSFALIYSLFGPRPVWFFLANTLVLMTTTWSLMRFIEKVGKPKLQACLTGLAFVLAGPVIENFYTLSKGEPWQVMFLALSFLAVLRYRSARSIRSRIGVLGLVASLQSMAHMAKETSLFVTLPFAVCWWVIERCAHRRQEGNETRQLAGAYLAASLLSTTLILLGRAAFVPAGFGPQGYTTRYLIQLEQIRASLIRWSGWLIRDFVYLAPLGIAVMLLALRSRRLPQAMLLGNASVWAIGWVAVFLPWYFMTEYYMLPFALGLAVVTGSLGMSLWKEFRQWLPLRFGALILSAVLFLATLLNNRTSAGIQLAVDAANEQMLVYLAREAPPHSDLIVNIRDSEVEYPRNIDQMLDVHYQRPDLTVLLPQALEAGEVDSTSPYILVPYIQNQPLLTVRLGVFEPSQESWNAKMDSYLASHPDWQPVARLERHFRLSILDFPRLFCPWIKTRSFCATPAPLIDTRLFSYGWKIYRYRGP